MMHNQFDHLQRANMKLGDERDELKRVVALHEQTIREMIDRSSEFMRETGDMIATLEQEARQMRARNERLERELAEAQAIINRYPRPDCGGAHHAS